MVQTPLSTLILQALRKIEEAHLKDPRGTECHLKILALWK